MSVGRSGSLEGALPVVEAVLVLSVVSSDGLRFIVGRSGSSAGVFPLLFAESVDVVLPEEAVVLVSVPLLSVRRFIVGRSGSSAGAGDVVDDVVVVSAVSSDRRFIVGRSGSDDDAFPELFADVSDVVLPEAAVVLPEDAEPDVAPAVAPASPESEEERRFMVGRSGSLLEALDVPLPESDADVLLWSAPEEVVSVGDFVCSLGRLVSADAVEPLEPVMTGRFFEGFSATAFRGAASGLTLP